MRQKTYSTMDEYIRMFPRPTQKRLRELRTLIQDLAPGAEERISYRMPAFFLNGPLVYFGAYEHHIGLYPLASGIRAFKSKLTKFQYSKGAVQIPLDEPLPKVLIRQIVRFKIAENLKKRKA